MSNTVLTEDEKAVVLEAMRLKAASVQRFINSQIAGSPMAKAGHDTMSQLQSVISKVAKL